VDGTGAYCPEPYAIEESLLHVPDVPAWSWSETRTVAANRAKLYSHYKNAMQ
jgi:hypothetical protein